MRKWTKSACVAAALGIGLLLAVVGFVAATGPGGSAYAAQANTSIASSSSSTQAGPAAPASLMTVSAAPVAARPAVIWVVRPGDTLSAIAAAFKVRGGWQALYAANRRVIGADPDVIRPGTALTVRGTQAPRRYTVAAGDTLSGIAAALDVRGGWQALYAANRLAIGLDPGLIRPGTVLAVPGQATAGKAPGHAPGHAPGTGPGSHRAPASPPARGGQPQGPAAGGPPVAPGPAGSRSTARGTPAAGGAGPDGIMPRWLKVTLVAVAILAVISFAVESARGIRRRRRADRTARTRWPASLRGLRWPPGLPSREDAGRRAAGQRAADQGAAAKMARFVQADHERLIVTYSMSDHTVYLLTPPGEDPRAVLRAARLILPEDTYEDLADHLGIPSSWQRE